MGAQSNRTAEKRDKPYLSQVTKVNIKVIMHVGSM